MANRKTVLYLAVFFFLMPLIFSLYVQLLKQVDDPAYREGDNRWLNSRIDQVEDRRVVIQVVPSSGQQSLNGPKTEVGVMDEATLEGSAAPARFFSVHDFIDHLSDDEVDMDSVVNFASVSDEAFDYIRSEYLMAEDRVRKLQLFNILNNCDHPARVELALDLISSENRNERKVAYQWLSHSYNTHQISRKRMSSALLQAMDTERDESLLAELITLFETPPPEIDFELYESATVKIKTLMDHEDDKVSASAISKIAQLSQDPGTLELLMHYVENSPLSLQMAALEGLRHLDSPSDHIMYRLDTLAQNPSVDRQVRLAAVELIVAYENDILPSVDLP